MRQIDTDILKGLAAARTMYGYDFQPSEALKALVYFEGGDLHSLCRDDQETLINASRVVRDLPFTPDLELIRCRYLVLSQEVR